MTDKNGFCRRTLTNNSIDVELIRQIARKDIVAVLNKFPEEKALVWDRALVNPLNLVADHSLFKENGVTKMLALEQGSLPKGDTPETILIICRPLVHLMKHVESIIQNELTCRRRKKYHLLFVPYKSQLCQSWLDNQHVFELIASTEVIPIMLFPLDMDVLTMELESCFKEYYGDQDPSTLHYVAEALMFFQRKYGIASGIWGKGQAAEYVYDILQSMKQETGNIKPQISRSKISNLILIDRQVDLLSPLVTQLTYEGLIDEFYGINCNHVKFPEEKFRESKQIVLNSSEDLFAELRDQNFSAVGAFLRLKTNNIQEIYRQKDKAQSMNEMKMLVQQLPALNTLKQSLTVHTSIAELLKENTERENFLVSLECEQELLNGMDVDKINPHIEELILKNAPFTKVLRLLLIQSITCNGGLRPKVLQYYEKLIVHNYGFEKFLNFEMLLKSGYLRTQGSRYAVLRRALNLTVFDGSETKPEDFSYVHSIYAPLSVRLVQHRLKPNLWNCLKDSLNTWIPSPTVDDDVQIPDSCAKTKQKTSVVVFIGGCTYAEISALRFLAKQEDDWDFLVITTKIINGDMFLDDIMDKPALFK